MEEKVKNDIVVRLEEGSNVGAFPVAIASLAEAAGMSPTDGVFRTRLWSALEELRAKTGRQIVQRRGMLVLLEPDEQLKDAIKKSGQSRRKRMRAIDVATKVPPVAIDDDDRRRRARFIDREGARAAFDSFTERRHGESLATTVAAPPEKKERRPRGLPKI